MFLGLILYFLFYLIFYLTLIFLAVVIVVKLWFEPTKGVCTCRTELHGKTALVTGGNSGIGLETARDLAKRGARVIIACRNAEKSEAAIADIIETTKNSAVEYRYLDLSKFSSVRKFCDDFNRTVDRLDILVNNAGCGGLRKLTVDNIEPTMQINHLGPFLLTNLLMNKLIASKPSRIVIVSSWAIFYACHFVKFSPKGLASNKAGGFWAKYCVSKLCNVLWAKALAKNLPNGVTANALHPGIVKTDIFNNLPGPVKAVILFVIQAVFKTPKEGAQTTVHVCVAPELETTSGAFYYDCRPCSVPKLAENEELVDKVWQESMALTQIWL